MRSGNEKLRHGEATIGKGVEMSRESIGMSSSGTETHRTALGAS